MFRRQCILSFLVILAISAAGALAWVRKGGSQKDEPRKLPVEAIHTTFMREHNYISSSSSFFRKGDAGVHNGIGPSNLFLVRAGSVEDAGRETGRVLWGGFSADSVGVNREGSEADVFWLVAYFGTTSYSTPPRWIIHGVEESKGTFRVLFSKPRQFEGEPASTEYFLWARLGHLAAGLYRLELFDVDAKESVLTRQTKVGRN